MRQKLLERVLPMAALGILNDDSLHHELPHQLTTVAAWIALIRIEACHGHR